MRNLLTSGLERQWAPKHNRVHQLVEIAARKVDLQRDYTHALLHSILDCCHLTVRYEKRRDLPAGPPPDKRGLAYREYPVIEQIGLRPLTEQTVRKVTGILFGDKDDEGYALQERLEMYEKLQDSVLSGVLPSLEQILCFDDPPDQRRLHEALKMRFLRTGLPSSAIYVMEPLMDAWELETLGRDNMRIVRCPDPYAPGTVAMVAERARQHRITQENMEKIDYFLRWLGCPPGPMEELSAILREQEDEEDRRRQEAAEEAARRAENSAPPPERNGHGMAANGSQNGFQAPQPETAAVSRTHAPAAPRSKRMTPALPPLPTDLAEAWTETAQLLSVNGSMPQPTERALREMCTILAGHPAFDAMLDAAARESDPARLEAGCRRLAVRIHADLAHLRVFHGNVFHGSTSPASARNGTEACLEYFAYLSALSGPLPQAMDLPDGNRERINRAGEEVAAGFLVTQAEEWQDREIEKFRGGLLQEEDSWIGALRVLATEDSLPPRLRRIAETGALALGLCQSARFAPLAPPALAGYVRIPADHPAASHIVLRMEKGTPAGGTEVAYDPATGTVSTLQHDPERGSIWIEQDGIGAAPRLPGSWIPLEDCFSPDGAPMRQANALAQMGKAQLRQLLEAEKDTGLETFRKTLTQFGKDPLRMLTLQHGGKREESFFLLTPEQQQLTGFHGEPPEDALLAALEAVRMPVAEGSVVLRRPPPRIADAGEEPAVELTNEDHHRIVRDFLIGLDLAVIPLSKVKNLLEIAGARIVWGTKHAKAYDPSTGASTAITGQEMSNGEMLMEYFIAMLFKGRNNAPPIGDKRALAEWILQGGSYRDV